MLNALKPREKKLLGIVIALLASLTIYFVLFKPLLSQLQTVQAQVLAKSITLTKYQRTLGEKAKIRKIYEQYLGLVGETKSAQEEISKFLKEVDEICSRAGVYIIDMKPLTSLEGEPLTKVRLEIEVTAQQSSLGKLLSELRNSKAYIHVDALRASTGAREGLKCYLVLSRLVA